MTIVTQGLGSTLLVTQGYSSQASAPPLLPTVAFTAAEIAPPSPPSPWSIDPNRTQEIP